MKQFWISDFGFSIDGPKNKKAFGLASSILLFALCAAADAQQPTKIPRIGFLFVSSLSSNSARAEAFRQGLRELGYFEGKNIIIEWRSADGKPDRLSALASELVHLKLDTLLQQVRRRPAPRRRPL